MRARPLAVAVVALALTLVSPLPAQQGPLKGLDAYVAQALKDWDAPGLAIAVVRHDSVVFAKGYGVRELGKAEAVDANTIFAIGSTSKAFTAALLGMLVDQGRIRWDDPVTRYLPGFQLYDPYVTREITIRDLLTHRSGLARGDGLWAASGYSRDEVIRRVRFLKPSWSFRSQYGYQNIMFLAAGELAGRVYGKSWDEVVRQQIFEPLGMTRTRTSVDALKGMDDLATPHERIDDAVRPVEWMNIDNIGPAGSITSSVNEMAQWVRLQLGAGSYAGRKLIEAKTVKEMHTLQMHIKPSETDEKLYPETHLQGYGLGWALRDYRGRRIVSHGGAIRGMRAQVLLVPEEQLGVVVLTNVAESALPTAIANRIMDLHLGQPVKDWSALYLAETKDARAKAADERKKTEAARVTGTTPSLALEKYTGIYADSMYGTVKVSQEGDHLTATFGPNYAGDLGHWHFDTFEVIWRNPVFGRAMFTFKLDAKGQVTALEVPQLTTFGKVGMTTGGAR